jgi:hypothetical protein
MPNVAYDLHGEHIYEYAAEGPVLRTSQDSVDLIGEARSHLATMAILPIGRLDPTFFQPRTGLAGEVLQKFVNYELRLVILGDYSLFAANSAPLRELIYESNRGKAAWFLVDRKELDDRLAPKA